MERFTGKTVLITGVCSKRYGSERAAAGAVTEIYAKNVCTYKEVASKGVTSFSFIED